MKLWKVRYTELVERELTFEDHSQAYEAALIAAKNDGGIARLIDPEGKEYVVQVTEQPKR